MPDPNDNLALDDDLQVHDTCDHYLIPAATDAVVLPDDIDALIADRIKAAEGAERVKRALLKLTKPHDWTVYRAAGGDKVRLTAQGSLRVAQSYGLNITSPAETVERFQDDNGKAQVRFILKGEVSAARYPHKLPIVGSADSTDGFITKEADVRKKAWANYLQRAITSIIGIGDMTIDDLREEGLDEKFINAIPSVTFKRGEASQAKAQERNNSFADEALALATKIAEDTGSSVDEVLLEASGFTGNDGQMKAIKAANIQRAPEKWLNKTLGKLRAMQSYGEDLGG
ncbi:MAG: hypothetical protein WC962_09595 [Phycisphaerae bacterium]